MNIGKTLNVFDNYNRVARLYPGLLTIAPVLWTLAALEPELLVGTASQASLSSLCLLGSLTLLSNIARWRGKHVERLLIERWGGWPTTALLRHRDNTIDSYTKGRYHKELERLCQGLKLPNADQEGKNPVEADERYRSATKCLIEKRREEKYELVHKENALYGFRRNLLGLKTSGLFILGSVTLAIIIIWWNGAPTNLSWHTILADVLERRSIYYLWAVNLLAMFIWLLVVRPSFVRQASEEYAIALFRTLETST